MIGKTFFFQFVKECTLLCEIHTLAYKFIIFNEVYVLICTTLIIIQFFITRFYGMY